MPIKNGDKVTVDYTGTFEDGTVFDSSEKSGQPLVFEIGSKQVIKGFENALLGMEKGEEKEIKLEPAEAYGNYNPALIKKIPRDKLPKDQELKPGMMLLMGLPEGGQIPVKITEIADAEVTIDLNHPLVGKALNFKLKVVNIT